MAAPHPMKSRILTPKVLRVLFIKIASKQPLYVHCPPNLTYSFLTVCKIITFKVDKTVFFPCVKQGQQSFEGKKNYFLK
jgi:hypothetical protein